MQSIPVSGNHLIAMGKSRAISDHTVLPATWQRWLSRLTPAEAGTQFSDPGGMRGWAESTQLTETI